MASNDIQTHANDAGSQLDRGALAHLFAPGRELIGRSALIDNIVEERVERLSELGREVDRYCAQVVSALESFDDSLQRYSQLHTAARAIESRSPAAAGEEIQAIVCSLTDKGIDPVEVVVLLRSELSARGELLLEMSCSLAAAIDELQQSFGSAGSEDPTLIEESKPALEELQIWLQGMKHVDLSSWEGSKESLAGILRECRESVKAGSRTMPEEVLSSLDSSWRDYESDLIKTLRHSVEGRVLRAMLLAAQESEVVITEDSYTSLLRNELTALSITTSDTDAGERYQQQIRRLVTEYSLSELQQALDFWESAPRLQPELQEQSARVLADTRELFQRAQTLVRVGGMNEERATELVAQFEGTAYQDLVSVLEDTGLPREILAGVFGANTKLPGLYHTELRSYLKDLNQLADTSDLARLHISALPEVYAKQGDPAERLSQLEEISSDLDRLKAYDETLLVQATAAALLQLKPGAVPEAEQRARVLILGLSEDVACEVRTIGESLNPAVPHAKIKTALDILVELGLTRREGSGFTRVSTDRIGSKAAGVRDLFIAWDDLYAPVVEAKTEAVKPTGVEATRSAEKDPADIRSEFITHSREFCGYLRSVYVGLDGLERNYFRCAQLDGDLNRFKRDVAGGRAGSLLHWPGSTVEAGYKAKLMLRQFFTYALPVRALAWYYSVKFPSPQGMQAKTLERNTTRLQQMQAAIGTTAMEFSGAVHRFQLQLSAAQRAGVAPESTAALQRSLANVGFHFSESLQREPQRGWHLGGKMVKLVRAESDELVKRLTAFEADVERQEQAVAGSSAERVA